MVGQSILSQLLLFPSKYSQEINANKLRFEHKSLDDFQQNRTLTSGQTRLHRSHDEDIWTTIF